MSLESSTYLGEAAMHFGVANWELPFGLSRVRHLIKSFPIHVVSVLRVKNSALDLPCQ